MISGGDGGRGGNGGRGGDGGDGGSGGDVAGAVLNREGATVELTDGSFGINQEKINNISVEVGVRVSLKKNTPEVR